MLCYALNFLNPSHRHIVPTGVLVIHPTTKNVVARGQNSLSDMLCRLYTDGFKVPTKDRFDMPIVLSYAGYDPVNFEKLMPLHCATAGLQLASMPVSTPLPEILRVTKALTLAEDGERINLSPGEVP